MFRTSLRAQPLVQRLFGDVRRIRSRDSASLLKLDPSRYDSTVCLVIFQATGKSSKRLEPILFKVPRAYRMQTEHNLARFAVRNRSLDKYCNR